MDVVLSHGDPSSIETPMLAIPLFEGADPVPGPMQGVDDALGGALRRRLERGDFRGKEGEVQLLFPDGAIAADRIALVGLGPDDAFDAEKARRAAASVVRAAEAARIARAVIMLPLDGATALPTERLAQSFAEGAVLAGYRYDETRTPPEKEDERPVRFEEVRLHIVAETADQAEAGARIGRALGRGENLARHLGNLPGNYGTPKRLAETAERIAAETGMNATILGPAELEAEGMKALLAVAQGSDEEPRLIVLEHRGGAADERPLVLVGKGLTFDTGGVSIKPSQGMEEMKFDMCGGAAVLGAMQAVGELGVERNVVGIVPSTENMVSGAAIKPGDVIGSHLGKTIEIISTDAEGRLILADALSYALRFDPAAVLDVATLTGACLIALGKHAVAVMGTDDALVEEVRAAGDLAGERAWPLPMYAEYRKQLDTEYADIKNSGGRPAGTITAGWFLREFVGDFPWAHLDIAGVAWGDADLPYRRKGATGVPTRLFLEWILARD